MEVGSSLISLTRPLMVMADREGFAWWMIPGKVRGVRADRMWADVVDSWTSSEEQESEPRVGIEEHHDSTTQRVQSRAWEVPSGDGGRDDTSPYSGDSSLLSRGTGKFKWVE